MSLWPIAVCLLLAADGGADRTIGYEADTEAQKRDTLLLRDFDPRPMVRLPEHHPPKARFPAIDVHNHLNDDQIFGERMDPALVVKQMDQANVASLVVLTGGFGNQLDRIFKDLVQAFPGRFYAFTQIDYSQIDHPDALVAELRRAVAKGAIGLKVLKDLGLTIKDPSGKRVAIDDPRLDPVWEEAGRLGIPVGIHTADPDAFFLPIDRHNERYEELIAHPDWSFYGPGFPSKAELLGERNRVIARHPYTRFIGLHIANHPEDLAEVSSWLDRMPNLYVETGARMGELGRQPRAARAFFIRYQDRILFGSDARPEAQMYRTWFRFFETQDEYFDYFGAPGQGRWKVSGLSLPDPVLKKLYQTNAQRLLRLKAP